MRFDLSRRDITDDKGVAAVEFALVASILITLVMGIIEFGLIFFTYNSAGSATRDIARRVATARLSSASASSALIQQLPGWVQSSTTVDVTQTASGSPTTNIITVTTTFPATKATPVNILSSFYANVTVTSSSAMQQEF